MASIQIVSFANYDVAEPEELLPEDSNCGKRKPNNYNPQEHKQRTYQHDGPMGLDLQNCVLTTLVGIGKLVDNVFFKPQNMTYLDVRCNQLESLEGIQEIPQLKILYMQGNKIDTLEKLLILQQLDRLESLTVLGNPLIRIPHYKSKIIKMMPWLRRLDNAGITYNDRQKAEYEVAPR